MAAVALCVRIRYIVYSRIQEETPNLNKRIIQYTPRVGPQLLPSLAERLPICHNLQNGIFIERAIVFIFDHPLLKCVPLGVYLPDPVYVALIQIVSESVPPAGEVLRPSRRARSSLGRNWLFGVLRMREPFSERLAVVYGLAPRHLGKRSNEVLPANPLARDLQVLSGCLGAVIERVPGEKADVRERDHGDVPVTDGGIEHECAILALDGP